MFLPARHTILKINNVDLMGMFVKIGELGLSTLSHSSSQPIFLHKLCRVNCTLGTLGPTSTSIPCTGLDYPTFRLVCCTGIFKDWTGGLKVIFEVHAQSVYIRIFKLGQSLRSLFWLYRQFTITRAADLGGVFLKARNMKRNKNYSKDSL